MPGQIPTEVHLVGSIGLDTVDDVFSTAGPLLGRRLRRIPDGEPGPRRLWVSFQYPLLRSSPFLRPDPSGALRKTSGFPLLCLAEGVAPDEVSFGELGYAREARGSYLDFLAARERGNSAGRPLPGLPADADERHLRLLHGARRGSHRARLRKGHGAGGCGYLRPYSAPRPLHPVGCVPRHDCLGRQPQDQFPFVNASKEEIAQRFVRICTPVPHDVELGFHLCYGDFGGKHFFDPVTARHLVDVANAIAKIVKHPIAYIHLPVPAPRATDEFFAPMREFKLAPETTIYLGLIHAADGSRAPISVSRWRKNTCRTLASPRNVDSRAPANRTWCASCSQFMLIAHMNRDRRDFASPGLMETAGLRQLRPGRRGPAAAGP